MIKFDCCENQKLLVLYTVGKGCRNRAFATFFSSLTSPVELNSVYRSQDTSLAQVFILSELIQERKKH